MFKFFNCESILSKNELQLIPDFVFLILNNISLLNFSYLIISFELSILLLMKLIIFSSFPSEFLVIFKLIFLVNLLIKNKGLPIHCIFPSDKIPILFPNSEASSMKCVVNIIIFPLELPFNISHKFLLVVISIPLVGSSKNIIELLPTKANAIDNILFWPPDKLDAFVYLFSVKFNLFKTDEISSSISEEGIDLNLQNNFKCSSTVRFWNKMSSCGHIPIIL